MRIVRTPYARTIINIVQRAAAGETEEGLFSAPGRTRPVDRTVLRKPKWTTQKRLRLFLLVLRGSGHVWSLILLLRIVRGYLVSCR
jgi:hypothetical protein